MNWQARGGTPNLWQADANTSSTWGGAGVSYPTQQSGAPVLTTNPSSLVAYVAWLAAHGRADGGRIPGAPSRTDNVLSWLATGEHVISSPAVAWVDRQFGPNFLDALNEMRFPGGRPHFDMGGRVGGGSGGGASSGFAGQPQVIVVNDWKTALQIAAKDGDFTGIIVDAVTGNKHVIGIPASV
jgi:hypothetical protein